MHNLTKEKRYTTEKQDEIGKDALRKKLDDY